MARHPRHSSPTRTRSAAPAFLLALALAAAGGGGAQECRRLELAADGPGAVPAARPFGDGGAWLEHTIDAAFPGALGTVAADLDGDGDLDVLAAASGSDELSWWENATGDGDDWIEHPLDGDLFDVRSVAAADLDGDHDLDVLAGAHFGSTVAWYENLDGAGGEWAKRVLGSDVAGAGSVAAADLDGDGDLDVLATAFLEDRILWWENLYGDGDDWDRHILAGEVERARSAVAGDLDGDGDLDVVASTELVDFGGFERIDAWVNTGDGSRWIRATIADRDRAEDIHLADLDGDGDLDVVAATDDDVAWWQNAGDGSSWHRVVIADRPLGQGTLHVADLDLDGDPDVLGGDDSPDELLWWENGGGWQERLVSDAFANPLAVFGADLDGDGDGDFLATSWQGGAVGWWENLPSGDCPPGEHRAGDVLELTADPDPGAGVAGWEGSDDDDTTAWVNRLTMPDADHAVTVRYAAGCFDLALAHAGFGADPVASPGRSEGCGAGTYVAGQPIALGAVPGIGQEVARWAGTDDDGRAARDNALTMPGADHVVLAEYTGTCFYLIPGHVGEGSDPLARPADPGPCTPGRHRAGDLVELLAGPAPGWEVFGWRGTDDDGRAEPENTVTMPPRRHEPVVGYVKACDTLALGHTGAGGDPLARILGRGELWSATTIRQQDRTRWVVATDLDGDGDTDVLGAALLDDSVDWWENLDGSGGTWAEHPVSESFHGAAAVAAGDLDGDGDLDVAAAAEYGDRLAWWESPRSTVGAWTEHPIDDSFAGPRSVALADLDGDRDLDVLAAGWDEHLVAWWENRQGDGLTWLRHTVAGLGFADHAGVADVDGDGDLDVVAAAAVGTVGWWENRDGDGLTWTEHPVADDLDGPTWIGAADLDGDGDLDLVATDTEDNNLGWWENTDGAGGDWAERAIADNLTGARGVAVLDADHDGDPDLVTAADGIDEITLWTNLGSGGAWSRRAIASGFADARAVAVADVDGDFAPDVVAGGIAPVTWWRNTPATFCTLPLASPGDVVGLQAAPAPGWGVGGWSGTDDDTSRAWRNRVTMPDGDRTVAVHYLEGCSALDLGHTGEGADPAAAPGASPGCAPGRYTAGQPIRLTAAPADGWQVDGWSGTDDDAVIAEVNTLTMPAADHQALVHYGLPCVRLTLTHGEGGGDPLTDPPASPGCPDGQFHPGTLVRLTATPFPGWEVASWSGTDDDGRTGPENEVTVPAWRHEVRVEYREACFGLTLSRTGEGEVPVATQLGDGLAWEKGVVAEPITSGDLAVADFDGDGDPDMLGIDRIGERVVWWSNLDGQGEEWEEHAVGTSFIGFEVHAADLDGDGDPDAIGLDVLLDAVLWWENRDGLGLDWLGRTIAADVIDPTTVATGDFDGDGDLDVLGTREDGVEVGWWENVGGDGGDWVRRVIDPAQFVVELVAADVDTDGDLDAVGAAAADDAVVWWRNDDGLGGAWTRLTVDDDFDFPEAVAAGDLDGDGDTDLLGAGLYADEVRWWQNEAGDGTSWIPHTVARRFDEAYDVAAHDVDGDGDLDIVAGARESQEVAWWDNLLGDASAWRKTPVDADFTHLSALDLADFDGDGDLDVAATSGIEDQVAWWANLVGGGCPAGSHHAGDRVHLLASPAPGWEVGGWTGTDDDAGDGLVNHLTMPAGDHEAAVHYVQSGGAPERR